MLKVLKLEEGSSAAQDGSKAANSQLAMNQTLEGHQGLSFTRSDLCVRVDCIGNMEQTAPKIDNGRFKWTYYRVDIIQRNVVRRDDQQPQQ